MVFGAENKEGGKARSNVEQETLKKVELLTHTCMRAHTHAHTQRFSTDLL